MNHTISTDKDRLDVALVHRYLSGESYWAKGIAKEVVERAIQFSLCFGVYNDQVQIGFARVITDYATFAYLADVFILDGHKGKGLGKQLIAYILDHPDLQGLRRWMLATLDAHELYQKYGFESLQAPHHFMARPGIKI